MKRLALAAIVLASCAAHKAAAPPPVAAASPPVAEALHWNSEIRASVLLSCQAHLGTGKLCDCLTEKLEVISPDPNVDFTPQDIVAGLRACRPVEVAGAEEL
ncbi:MAG TPA: hypothetical protein VFG59_10465 [Anaeromyxobacter sp.]|nr:hypothetical protein [Anaeromyxobacter sp.]